MEIEEFKNILKLCVNKMYEDDKKLFNYNTSDPLVAERCLAFRLGYYLQNELPAFNVDSEYNKHISGSKYIDNHRVFPDIIIHSRCTDNNNFSWIEIKKQKEDCNKPWKEGQLSDIEKLTEVTKESGQYKYKIGVMLVLNQSKPEISYFSNGKGGEWECLRKNN